MEGNGKRFDDLARGLAAARSRRAALRALAGGAAAGAVALGARHDADAATCRAKGILCLADAHCCSNACDQETHRCVLFFDVAAAPAAVWQALTDRAALASWAFENDVAPHVGQRFTLRAPARAGFDGVMEGQVLALEPARRLVFSWRGGPLTTPATVTLRLAPLAGGGTRLWLDHDSGDSAPCRAAALLLGREWQQTLFAEALPRHLGAARA